MSKKKSAQEIAVDALKEAKAEGLSDEDAKWLAVGAVNRAAREAGVIDDELTAEMNAASQAVVKQATKKK